MSWSMVSRTRRARSRRAWVSVVTETVTRRMACEMGTILAGGGGLDRLHLLGAQVRRDGVAAVTGPHLRVDDLAAAGVALLVAEVLVVVGEDGHGGEGLDDALDGPLALCAVPA